MDKSDFAKYINAIANFKGELNSLNDNISAIAPGAVCDIGGHFLDSYIALLSESVGDDDNWIDWFVWENGFGKKKLQAGYDGKEKKICNVDQLLELIEEGKKHE